MIRKKIYYSGRVQGVGFRATTLEISAKYPVAGYVRNLPDGRVELRVEGTEEAVNAFLDEVKKTLGDYIKDVQISEDRAEEAFREFSIRR